MSQDESDGWSKRARIGLLVLGLLLGAVAAPAIYAQVTTTEDYHMGEGMVIGSPSGLEVELGQDLTNDRQHLSPSNDAIDLRPVRLEADGDARATISGWDSEHLVLADLDASSNELRVRPSSQSDIDIDGAATRVEIGSVAVDDGTDDVRVTTTGSTTLQVWGLPADETVVAIDGDSGDRIETVTTDGEGVATFSVSQDRDVRFRTAQPPTIDDVQPADGATISNYSTTISATIDDPDFDESWGDDVTVTFEEADTGDEIGSTTISSAQTVSAEWSGLDMGPNEWRVVAEDSDGNEVTNGPNTINAPDELEIRDELNQSLVTGDANVTVSFFPTGGEVFERSTEDGVIDLSGLPSDETIFVQANAEGYHSRTAVIRDISEQQTVYMLPESAESVSINFILNDQTGDFPTENTQLIIEKAIEQDNESDWRMVAGDEFGVGGVNAELATDDRYRLRVRNQAGDERVLGSYVPSQPEVRELTVGSISWEVGDPEAEQLLVESRYFEDGDDEFVRFQLSDQSNTLEDVQVAIFEDGNRENVLHNTTHAGPYGTLSVVEGPLTPEQENATWVVEWSAQRNGETISGRDIVGSADYGIETTLSDRGMELVAVGLIVFIAGFFPASMAAIGAVVVSLAGLLLWAVGWLNLPLSWILAALAVGAIARAVKSGGFQS